MSSVVRAQLLGFFRQYLTRRPVSRQVLSGILSVAYPSLDPTLERLREENILETTSGGEWRPTLAFMRVELAKQEHTYEQAAAAAQRLARVQARRDELNRQREAARSLRRVKKLEKLEAQQRERELKRQQKAAERAAENERGRLERAVERRNRKTAERLALELAKNEGKIPPALVEPVVFKPAIITPSSDAWAKVRERHYAKPIYLGSDFKPDARKMMARR